ncbi:MAG: class I SAM-dependent methyltransferase [Thermodesulfobacteriota bacterium]
MNLNELQWFTPEERRLPDVTALPMKYLLKSLGIKAWKKLLPARGRFVWTVTAISDAHGPTANVRNYLEHQTIRQIVGELAQGRKLRRACEIGCGYGRIIMVLKEFADYVKGFEREEHLVETARSLLPDLEFQRVDSLTAIPEEEPYDLVMICAVLQHLTDAEAQQVCKVMQTLAPNGHILVIEKTEAINVTENIEDGSKFLSRARSIETYQQYLAPYSLVSVRDRVVEPTYNNPQPGKCMLFVSPGYKES